MRTFPLVFLLAALASGGCAWSVAFLSPNLKLHITNVTAVPPIVPPKGESALTAAVDDPSGGKLTYTWAAHSGTLIADGAKATYLGESCCLSSDVVAVTVQNEKGEKDTRLLSLTVLQPPDSTADSTATK